MALDGPKVTQPPFQAQLSPHPKKSAQLRTQSSPPDREALAAEREAQIRIAESQTRLEDAERTTSKLLEDLRDEYIRQYENQSARQDASLESERQKGYEAIRDLQRSQQMELNRVKREGERNLDTVKNYYRDTLYNSELTGKQKLEEIKSEQYRAAQHEELQSGNDFQFARDEHQRQLTALNEEQKENYENLNQSAKQEFERNRENTQKATELSNDHFKTRIQELNEKHNQEYQNIASRSSQQLHDLRWDSSRKLDAYSSRQEDPFYQMVDINASLEETGENYILTATVPKQEQQNISVNIRGNQLIVSGQRRNEEKLEVEPGHQVSTAAYQNYSETFPLSWPVDSRSLTRRFDGDTLIVEIPKKFTYTAPSAYQAKRPERARLQRPDFPFNLPVSDETPPKLDQKAVADAAQNEPTPAQKRFGSRPLT